MSDYLHIHTLVKGSHNHTNNRHSRHLPMWSCASLFGLLVFLLGLWKDTRPSFKFIMYCNICVYYIKRRSLESINLIYLKLNTYWTTQCLLVHPLAAIILLLVSLRLYSLNIFIKVESYRSLCVTGLSSKFTMSFQIAGIPEWNAVISWLPCLLKVVILVGDLVFQ